jgi:hypothetical protein
MVEFIFPDFLNSSSEYAQAEALWQSRWQELIRWVGQEGLWRTPWINTAFANGTTCRDGNPIFSAVCVTRRLGIRVIQQEPAGIPRELYFWTDTFAQGQPEAVNELVISCVLTDETLYDALDLMHQWITKEEIRLLRVGYRPTSADVQLSPRGYYPTFPVSPDRARTARREPALC